MRAFVHPFAATLAVAASMAAHAQVSYTWTDVTPRAGGESVYHVAVHPHQAGRLVVTGSFGRYVQGLPAASIMVTDDAGATWRPSTSNPGTSQFTYRYDRLYSHVGHPGVLFLSRTFGTSRFGRASGEVSFLRSHDFGLTWVSGYATRTGPEPAVAPFASDPFDPNRLFGTLRSFFACSSGLGCSTPGDTTVVESRDGGVSWSAPLAGLPPGNSFSIGVPDPPTPVAPMRMFFTVADTVFVSRNGGATWTPFDTGAAGPLRWVKQDPRRANVLYAVQRRPWTSTERAKLLRSDDEGATWRTIFEVDGNVNDPMLTIDPVRSNELWLTGVAQGLSRSVDSGSTWIFIGGAAEYRQGSGGPYLDSDTILKVLTVHPADPGVVYAVWKGQLLRGEPSVRPNPVVVEYRYGGDRYWMAWDAEALSQDYRANPAQGRTGARFGVWHQSNAPLGALGSCRFWSPSMSTRLLTLKDDECEVLRGDPAWILEAENEFFAVPPWQGTCNAWLAPVRRFTKFNGVVSHRYVTDPQIAAETRARGWADEGVVMCARPLGSNE